MQNLDLLHRGVLVCRGRRGVVLFVALGLPARRSSILRLHRRRRLRRSILLDNTSLSLRPF